VQVIKRRLPTGLEIEWRIAQGDRQQFAYLIASKQNGAVSSTPLSLSG
jgi:hypothetical protein